MGKYVESFYNSVDSEFEKRNVAEFCRKNRISPTALNSWLRHETTPTLKKLELLAEGLETTPMSLITPRDAADPPLDSDLRRIVGTWKNLSPYQREMILGTINEFLGANAGKKAIENTAKGKKSTA